MIEDLNAAAVPPAALTAPRVIGAKVLDATNNIGRPDELAASSHMRRGFVPHSWQLNAPADYDQVAALATDRGMRLVLDLEVGAVTEGYPSGNEPPDELEAAVADRVRHFDEFRARLPNDPLAIYAFNPGSYAGVYYAVTRHEAFLDPNSPAWMRDLNNPETAFWAGRFAAWQQGNDNLNTLIGDRPDYLAPQVYVFNNDRQQFDYLLRGSVNEARRQAGGKPVYAFLCPYYWEADNNPNALQPADYDFFRYELESALRLADGVVLWGGFQFEYDQSADWVRALRDVVAPPAATISVAATDASASEAGDLGTFTITRDHGVIDELTVHYTLGGTASAGGDYAALSGSVVIPAGQYSVDVAVTPIDDPAYEGNELVSLTLAADPAYLLANSPSDSASINLADNDPVPQVSLVASDASAAETGNNPGAFRVSRTGDLGTDLVISYAVAGSATAGADYQALPGTVTIPAGQSSVTIAVLPINDAAFEAGETVVATLADGLQYDLATAYSGTVTITSDDAAPLVNISATDNQASEAGDPGAFTVTRNGDLSAPLVVSYAVGGGATAGSDYQTLPGTVTIPAGQSSATISLLALDDTAYESSESVMASLIDGAAYNLGPNRNATISITSDDPQSAPAAPSQLSGTASAGPTIVLTWRDNSSAPSAESGFLIEMSLDKNNWSAVGTVDANVTTFTKTGLAPSTWYYFRVRAVNVRGSSAWSNVLKIRSSAS